MRSNVMTAQDAGVNISGQGSFSIVYGYSSWDPHSWIVNSVLV